MKKILATGSILVVCLTLNITGVSAATPSTEILISIEEDGTPSFDAGAPEPGAGGAGLDAGPNNGILRTYDTARVRMDWNVNDAPGSNVRIISNLPDGMSWVALPPVCAETGVLPASAITGTSMICNLGDQPEGENGTVEGVVRLGGVLNNQNLEWDVSIRTDESSPVDSNPVSVLSSAAPKVDLIKEHPAVGTFEDIVDPGSGENGMVFLFPITVEVGGSGKGAEPLNGDPLTITDDLSGMPASAKLVDFSVQPPFADVETCGPNNYQIPSVPYGTIGLSSTSTAENSSFDSGNWSCSQNGTDIDITITGANTSPPSAPTIGSGGLNLGVNRSVVISGVVGVWISRTDLLMGNPEPGPIVMGSISNSVDWIVQPTGVSGGPNTGENPANNQVDANYSLTGPGGFYASYVNTPGAVQGNLGYGVFQFLQPGNIGPLAPGYTEFVPTQTQSTWAGDGTVVPSQQFGHIFNFENNWGEDRSVGMCVQISGPQVFAPAADTLLADFGPDESLQAYLNGIPAHMSSVPSAGTPFIANSVFSNGIISPFPGFDIPLFEQSPLANDGSIQFEYSTDAHTHDGQCSDSNYSWSSSPPADLSTVTQVRYWITRPTIPNEQLRIYTGLQSTAAPLGTYFKSTGSIIQWNDGSTTIPDAAWTASPPYDPNTPPNGSGLVDRLQIGGPFLNFRKAITSDQLVELRAGDTITYEVNASVVGEPSGEVENLVIEDIIPAGLSYAGNADPAPTNGAGPGDANLEWDFGTVDNNTDFQITYDVQLEPGYSPFQAFLNTAEINADFNDGNGLIPLGPISSSIMARAGGVFSEAEILKSTATPLIPEDGTMSFDLQYANTGVSDLGDVDLIEILPFNGDGREPATDFTGTIALSNVDAPNGETVLYANAAPESVVIDPDDPSNGPGGSTQWCTAGEFGDPGCPADLEDSTALRFQRVGTFVAGDEFHIGIDIDTQNNLPNDVYTNEFGGRTDGIKLPIRSNDVPVRVEGVDVRIDKEPAAEGPYKVGNEITYEIILNNRGPGDATNIEVVDELPEGLEFVSANKAGQHSNGKVSWIIGELAAKESTTLEVTTQAVEPGELVNFVLITGLDQSNRGARSEDRVAVEVLDQQATTTTTTPAPPTVPPTNPPDGSLPFTGTSPQAWFWGALGLIALGASAILRLQKTKPIR